MVNMACRDEKLKASVVADIKAVFSTVYSQSIPENVNEVLFAWPEPEADCGSAQKDVARSIKVLQQATQAQAKGAEVPDLEDMLDKLKLL